jgi:superfamily II DNA/RNA helicase
MGFIEPTPIQKQSIPVALNGEDILASAQTGSGKTAAFAIPIIENLTDNDAGIAIILTPTRELANQIYEVFIQLLGFKNTLKVISLIGGESITPQLRNLKKKPRIVIGTPGRINDHINRKSLSIKKTNILVLDETDRMLDMGFEIQIEDIVKNMPKKRQTLMFSATIPTNISKLAEKYLSNPKRIAIGSVNEIPKNLKQEVLKIKSNEKYNQLLSELKTRKGSVLVFIKTKYACDRMAKKLSFDGVKAMGIHGDLKQNKRNRIIADFRNNKFSILIGTDIVCRGLDVPHIEHVINFDLPQVAEDFIHRIGRTARAGQSGSVISFLTSQDHLKWRAIQKILDPKLKKITAESKNNKNKFKEGNLTEKKLNNKADKKKKLVLNKKNNSNDFKNKKNRSKKKYKKPMLQKADNRTKFIDEEIVFKIIKEST